VAAPAGHEAVALVWNGRPVREDRGHGVQLFVGVVDVEDPPTPPPHQLPQTPSRTVPPVHPPQQPLPPPPHRHQPPPVIPRILGGRSKGNQAADLKRG
jgi:hypothetical protein